MNSIKILIQGYAKTNEDATLSASPTTVLIESNEKRVLVDPGANRELLFKSMSENNISNDDIDIVYLTHYHPDHMLNIRLFPDHDIYDYGTIYSNDLETFYSEVIPGTDIKIITTPGHAAEHSSLSVVVDGETYVVAQDVFWWMDGKQKSDTVDDLLNLEDPYATDAKELLSSRKKVLAIADWIIPGHGKIFKNPAKVE